MIEDQSPSSERTKAAKEQVPGKEATDQHQDLVLDLATRAIAMLVIVKVVEDVEDSKVAVVAEGMSEAAEEAAADEVEGTISQVEMRTQRQQQHRLLKIRSPRQRLQLQLQLPRVTRLELSLFDMIQ